MRIITDTRGQPQFVFLLENIDAISGVGQQQRKSINFYSKSLNEVERRIFASKTCKKYWYRYFIPVNQIF